MTRQIGGWTLVLVLVAACGSKGGSYTVDDIESGPVKGTIGGADWAMVTANIQADPFGDGSLSISLYAEELETCGYASTELPFVLFSVDAAVGEYPLSFSLTEPGNTVAVEPPSRTTSRPRA